MNEIIHFYKYKKALSEWDEFVNQIEVGYILTLDDYTNDLSIRQIIKDNENLLTSDQLNRLESIDKRFFVATQQVNVSLLGKYPKSCFWWYRIPILLIGEMLESVKEQKILDEITIKRYEVNQ